MRTAQSIISDILKEECNTISTEQIERIAGRILQELRLEQTITMYPKAHTLYNPAKRDVAERKEQRLEDNLYKAIRHSIKEEYASTRIYNILRRNDYNSIEDLLTLDGELERIKRMRNCGESTTNLILKIINDIKKNYGVKEVPKLSYCDRCEDLVEYSISVEDVTDIYQDEEVIFPFAIGRCKKCGNEVTTCISYDYQKSQSKIDAFCKKKDLITRQELAELLKLYGSSTELLAEKSGISEYNIKFYLDGGIPTKENSEIIKQLIYSSGQK